MATAQKIKPETLEEKVIWYALRYTLVFYFTGTLYVVAPVIGWCLLFLLFIYWFEGKENIVIPAGVWLWALGMLVMLVALLAGHFNFELGLGKTIKSTFGWAKGWALLAVFPCLACLDIRPQVITRAVMQLCKQCLFLIPIVLVLPYIGVPGDLFTSPLKAIADEAFFQVQLYGRSPEGAPRWRLFTPWAPALGLVGNIYFALSLYEKDNRFKWFGIIAAITMVLISQSRMGLLCLLILPFLRWGMSRLTKVWVILLLAILAPVAGILYVPTVETVDNTLNAIHSARADSSRVRGTLANIAIYRWKTEAPIFGHGIVEDGPHLVEYMPIGSHHSWYGLLFVKGLIGFIALLIPMLFTLFSALLKVQSNPRAAPALQIILILFMYSLSENLETLVYIYWPGLIVLGLMHRERWNSDELKQQLLQKPSAAARA